MDSPEQNLLAIKPLHHPQFWGVSLIIPVAPLVENVGRMGAECASASLLCGHSLYMQIISVTLENLNSGAPS